MENKKKIGPKRKYTKKVVPPKNIIPSTNSVIEQPINSNTMYSIELISASPIETRNTKKVISPIKSVTPIPANIIEQIQPPPIKKQKRKYTKKRIEKEPYIIPIESPMSKIESPKIESPQIESPKIESPQIEKPPSPVISNAVIKIKRNTKKKEIPKEKILMPEYIEHPIPVMEIDPDEKKEIKQKIEEYKENGYSILSSYDKETIQEMVRICLDAYHNKSVSLITDSEYDILEDFYKTKWPSKKAEVAIGAPISGKNKVTLPFQMASMDKIKPDSNILANWVNKYRGPYVLSCKLDGVSGLYTCDDKGEHHLYTRGDGYMGQDISHLINPLHLPKLTPNTAIRGEFVMPKHLFQEKYKTSFANARNLVSGMVNRKGVDEKINDLHYVTYEVITPIMTPGEQLLFSKQLGLKVVQYQINDQISNEYLSSLLVDWRAHYYYEIDGVIVNDNKIYPREEGNPEHAFAFKMVLSDQVAEAKVVDVIWTPSKDGYLKPRVRIEPIQLAGIRIEYATGFNGKFIQDNRIGLGAIITMVRSGDVIPYIKSVTSPAEHALMPKVPYTWTDTLVDIVLQDSQNNNTVLEKNITYFFVSLEVDGLSTGNIKRMMAAGFTSIHSILLAKKEDFEKVEGFKEKTIEKIYNSIQEKVGAATLLDIVCASGKLGRGLGKRKVAPILKKYPDILTSSLPNHIKIQMLREVEGIAEEGSKEFVENIPDILEFLRITELEYKLINPIQQKQDQSEEKSIQNTGHPFFQKKIVMTKTRDKDVISFIERMGGILEDNIKKDTILLIVKSKEDTSSKTEYAKKNGIPILSVDEFKTTYLSN